VKCFRQSISSGTPAGSAGSATFRKEAGRSRESNVLAKVSAYFEELAAGSAEEKKALDFSGNLNISFNQSGGFFPGWSGSTRRGRRHRGTRQVQGTRRENQGTRRGIQHAEKETKELEEQVAIKEWRAKEANGKIAKLMRRGTQFRHKVDTLLDLLEDINASGQTSVVV